MPEPEDESSLFRLFKLAKGITWVFIFISVLALVYTYWRAEISYRGVVGSFYLKFYLISALGALFWGSVLWLKDRTRLNLVIIASTIIVGAYMVELFLYFTTASIWKEPAQIAAERGIPYDKRTKLDVIEDLKKEGKDVVPAFWPYNLLISKGAIGENGKPFYPVSGVSKKTAVLCNETGKYAIYASDRYGFNNPDSVWDENQTEWLLIGDSFAHGNCVDTDMNIAGQISQLTHNAVINLGSGGNGPLIELATFIEYAVAKKPKRVIWTYCDNDFFNLIQEQEVPTLMSYLKNDFSQDLVNRQSEIDSYLNKYLVEQMEKEIADKKVGKKVREEQFFTKFIRLYHLRKQTGLNIVDTNILGVPVDVTPLYTEILTKVKNMISEWDGELYIVYLPTLMDYQNEGKHKKVLDLVKSLGIPVIDIHSKVFANHPNPIELFPFELENHYTEEGYNMVSRAIFEAIEKK
jgi:hypothetical protein